MKDQEPDPASDEANPDDHRPAKELKSEERKPFNP